MPRLRFMVEFSEEGDREALEDEIKGALEDYRDSGEIDDIDWAMFSEFPPEAEFDVTVSIKGGALIETSGPVGMHVIVYDYDIDGADEEQLSIDADGAQCIISEVL